MAAIVPVPVACQAVTCGSVQPRAPGTPDSADEVLELTLPPASFLDESDAHRQGLAGSTLVGCYIAIPGRGATANTYVWFTHDDGGGRYVGVDPGDFDTGLSGYTGVEVQLAAGNRTAAQVATAVDAALDAAAIYTSVSAATDTVTITGSIDAASAFTGGSYAAAGGGAIDDEIPALGRHLGWPRDDTASNSFAAESMRGMMFRAADLPSGNFRITGLEVYWGDVHTGQITFAIYQGGTAAHDFEGASLLGVLGTTSGSALDQWVSLLCTPANVFDIDPTAGNLWLVWAADTDAQFNFEGSLSTRPLDSHFEPNASDSNNTIYLFDGGASGSGATFPSTAPALAGAGHSAFTGAFRLSIQEAPYYGDLNWRCRLGLLMTFDASGTSTMTGVFTSHAFTVPNVLGIEADRAYVYYQAHDAGEQFRVEWWEGGTSDTVISGADLAWDCGQTTGTATGWVGIVDSGSHPLTANARLWMSVKADTGSSSIGFNPGAGYDGADTPAVYYRGDTTESEYTVANGETTIDFDPSVQSGDPLATNSTVINPGNSVGAYGIARVPGFAMAANP